MFAEITISWESIAAITVVLSFLFGVVFWLGSKMFATRKDFHEMQSSIVALRIKDMQLENDIAWLKGKHPKSK